jgi:hypothetical protein
MEQKKMESFIDKVVNKKIVKNRRKKQRQPSRKPSKRQTYILRRRNQQSTASHNRSSTLLKQNTPTTFPLQLESPLHPKKMEAPVRKSWLQPPTVPPMAGRRTHTGSPMITANHPTTAHRVDEKTVELTALMDLSPYLYHTIANAIANICNNMDCSLHQTALSPSGRISTLYLFR